MSQHDDDECKLLPMYIHHNAVKRGCDYLDALKRTRIHLKKWHLSIHVARFVVVHTIEDAAVCDAASRGNRYSRVGQNQTTAMQICDRWMQKDTTDRRGR
ncbi:hypothetical protein TNCV_4325211 [Trichonephila clavipes]|nr:hypothetical protein TNCV_4325211 [Trichonephila clavipes]